MAEVVAVLEQQGSPHELNRLKEVQARLQELYQTPGRKTGASFITTAHVRGGPHADASWSVGRLERATESPATDGSDERDLYGALSPGMFLNGCSLTFKEAHRQEELDVCNLAA